MWRERSPQPGDHCLDKTMGINRNSRVHKSGVLITGEIPAISLIIGKACLGGFLLGLNSSYLTLCCSSVKLWITDFERVISLTWEYPLAPMVDALPASDQGRFV